MPIAAIVSLESVLELGPLEVDLRKIAGSTTSSTKTIRMIGRNRWKFGGTAQAYCLAARFAPVEERRLRATIRLARQACRGGRLGYLRLAFVRRRRAVDPGREAN